MTRGVPALLVLLLPALAGSSCGRSAAPPRTVPDAGALDSGLRRAYLKALERSAEGDGPGADRALAPLLAHRPLHVPSHLLHQDLGRAVGAGEALAEEYRALSRTLPGDASAAVLATRAAGGAANARLTAYQAAAVKDPAAPWPRIALATERADLARELVKKAQARTLQGFAAEGEGLRALARTSLDRALTEGKRAVEVAPDLAAAHAALGHVLALSASLLPRDDKEKRDLRAAAIERLGKALALDPGDPSMLAGRGLVRQEAGLTTEAQADFDAAAAAAPGDPVLLSARAGNLEKLQMYDRAIDAWRMAAAAAPGNAEILVDFGSSLARAGRWKDALEQYRAADARYAVVSGERWKARRGLVTALVQIGLAARGPELLAEALVHLKAYRDEGGPDADWAGRMSQVLGEEAAPPPVPAPPGR